MGNFMDKIEKISEDSLDSIPSPGENSNYGLES
jgi:hypothetical protein